MARSIFVFGPLRKGNKVDNFSWWENCWSLKLTLGVYPWRSGEHAGLHHHSKRIQNSVEQLSLLLN